MLKVRAADGTYKIMRTLIDQGSQVSIISENAAQRLALPRRNCKGSIYGVVVKPNSCKGVLHLTCSSMDDNYVFDTSVFIMQNLIKQLPNSTFAKPSWSFLNNIQLADPDFNISRPVDLLLGADIYSNIILPGICREEDQSMPIAQQTRLGWILCGNTKTYQCNVILNNIEQIEKFWETEDITEHFDLSEEDLQCIQYYEETTKRLSDGRYEVRLPLKPGYEKQLGSSKNKAIAHFLSMERKFRKNNSFEQNYKAFIHEYLALGHMKPADSMGRLECYIPHHGVQRPESTTTALRVVFNGSCKTSTGSSLNDVMYAGPNLQQDLQELLIKWRQFEIVFTADIEKMFRQIWIHQDDQLLQKIIWRDCPSSALQDLQLCTVTYGTKAAPFLAMMTLKRLANDERRNDYSTTAIQTLEKAMYMDDLLYGAHSMTSALELQQELIRLLQSGGFNLRKWNSNKEELLNINNNQDNKNFNFKHAHSSKTLGLSWISKQDIFTFQTKITDSEKKCTKRSLLSEISKQFDPIGLIAPITLRLKLLFQKVWQLNLQWDDELPEEIQVEWINMKHGIKMIDQLQIPRWLGTKENSLVELHGFCDSSERAFGCAIYCRTSKNHHSMVVLVAAKTRLVPIKKPITIPRLELNAAVLLSKLMNKVVNCLSTYNIQIFGWCDSTAVLGWLHGDAARWKPFVANRVKQVITNMPPACWRYVKSEENPADCASRGLTAGQLKDHPLWWQGPSWLLTYKQDVENNPMYTTNEEEKQVLVAQKAKEEEKSYILPQLIEKQSSFTRLVRILAWILRVKKDKTKQRQPYLTISELQTATNLLIKHVQSAEFKDDINNITQNKQVPKKSPLSKLNPFIDKNGILRVDGRLELANITYNMKHPIILPNRSRFTQLLIDSAHKITFHGGARLTSAFIRQKYWIVGGNRTIKRLIRTCITCRRYAPSIQPQIMGDLPEARTNPSRPFYHTGVDYTGYVDVKASKGRGIKQTRVMWLYSCAWQQRPCTSNSCPTSRRQHFWPHCVVWQLVEARRVTYIATTALTSSVLAVF
ncbi:unnamed protein product [Parnassius mnemosyne]|uniref:Integrase zinc-binding domain-containing protein n=1 Tax=Parnassius mnemosyne TaxID=213953 RepID=A0AAV1L672_9NEOP